MASVASRLNPGNDGVLCWSGTKKAVTRSTINQEERIVFSKEGVPGPQSPTRETVQFDMAKDVLISGLLDTVRQWVLQRQCRRMCLIETIVAGDHRDGGGGSSECQPRIQRSPARCSHHAARAKLPGLKRAAGLPETGAPGSAAGSLPCCKPLRCPTAKRQHRIVLCLQL